MTRTESVTALLFASAAALALFAGAASAQALCSRIGSTVTCSDGSSVFSDGAGNYIVDRGTRDLSGSDYPRSGPSRGSAMESLYGPAVEAARLEQERRQLELLERQQQLEAQRDAARWRQLQELDRQNREQAAYVKQVEAARRGPTPPQTSPMFCDILADADRKAGKFPSPTYLSICK